MYGGKFLPFHLGHKYCIETAAHECETLYVIMFTGGTDEEKVLQDHSESCLTVEYRTKQLNRLCEDACRHARVIPVIIDISGLRLPDGSEDWEAETPLVRNIVGDRLDAVYSSEESYEDYFSRAYPEAVHRLVDIGRINYPISGTAIRDMESEEERAKWMV